jgi:hypothetical protein
VWVSSRSCEEKLARLEVKSKAWPFQKEQRAHIQMKQNFGKKNENEIFIAQKNSIFTRDAINCYTGSIYAPIIEEL